MVRAGTKPGIHQSEVDRTYFQVWLTLKFVNPPWSGIWGKQNFEIFKELFPAPPTDIFHRVILLMLNVKLFTPVNTCVFDQNYMAAIKGFIIVNEELFMADWKIKLIFEMGITL